MAKIIKISELKAENLFEHQLYELFKDAKDNIKTIDKLSAVTTCTELAQKISCLSLIDYSDGFQAKTILHKFRLNYSQLAFLYKPVFAKWSPDTILDSKKFSMERYANVVDLEHAGDEAVLYNALKPVFRKDEISQGQLAEIKLATEKVAELRLINIPGVYVPRSIAHLVAEECMSLPDVVQLFEAKYGFEQEDCEGNTPLVCTLKFNNSYYNGNWINLPEALPKEKLIANEKRKNKFWKIKNPFAKKTSTDKINKTDKIWKSFNILLETSDLNKRRDADKCGFTRNAIEENLLAKQDKSDLAVVKYILSKMKLSADDNSSAISFGLKWAPISIFQVT